MYATMFLMLFLLFIPKTIKNTGIKMMIDGKKQGIVMFMFSKILWVSLVSMIASIWFEGLVLNLKYDYRNYCNSFNQKA